MSSLQDLHPVLAALLQSTGTVPPGDPARISAAVVRDAVELAISLAPPEVQALTVSRIMSDDDVARHELQSVEHQDVSHRVALNGAQRRLALMESPEAAARANNNNAGNGANNDGEDARVCIVCDERRKITVSCGCHYCFHCLRMLIRMGLASVAAFPPRCCEPLTEGTVHLAGQPALVHLYRQLKMEVETPADRRLYCHDPECAAFIPPQNITDKVGKCPDCDTGEGGGSTCSECRQGVHPGLPCEEDDGDDESFWTTMDEQHMVGCPTCGLILSLRDGCNHMRCICGTDFCYLCGVLRDGHGPEPCECPLYGHMENRVPIRDRPGVRPISMRGRDHLRRVAGRSNARLPQLTEDPVSDGEILALLDTIPPQEPQVRPRERRRRHDRAVVFPDNGNPMDAPREPRRRHHPNNEVVDPPRDLMVPTPPFPVRPVGYASAFLEERGWLWPINNLTGGVYSADEIRARRRALIFVENPRRVGDGDVAGPVRVPGPFAAHDDVRGRPRPEPRPRDMPNYRGPNPWDNVVYPRPGEPVVPAWGGRFDEGIDMGYHMPMPPPPPPPMGPDVAQLAPALPIIPRNPARGGAAPQDPPHYHRMAQRPGIAEVVEPGRPYPRDGPAAHQGAHRPGIAEIVPLPPQERPPRHLGHHPRGDVRHLFGMPGYPQGHDPPVHPPPHPRRHRFEPERERAARYAAMELLNQRERGRAHRDGGRHGGPPHWRPMDDRLEPFDPYEGDDDGGEWVYEGGEFYDEF